MIRRPLLAVVAIVAFAASLSAPRTAQAIVYRGAPDLKLTVDLVTAGSGPNGFDSKVLFAAMFGSHAGAEAKRLTALYGAHNVAEFFPLMDYSIGSVLTIVKRDHVPLPAADSPLDGKLVVEKLYEAGQTKDGRYDVGFMLEHLITHPYHHELMSALNGHYTAKDVAGFHEVLGRAVMDAAAG